MSTTTQVTSRRDIDRILSDLQTSADYIAERARNDPSLSISEVWVAEEDSREIMGYVEQLERLVMLPQDLFEELWAALEAADALTNKAHGVTASDWLDVARRAAEVLPELRQYNNS